MTVLPLLCVCCTSIAHLVCMFSFCMYLPLLCACCACVGRLFCMCCVVFLLNIFSAFIECCTCVVRPLGVSCASVVHVLCVLGVRYASIEPLLCDCCGTVMPLLCVCVLGVNCECSS